MNDAVTVHLERRPLRLLSSDPTRDIIRELRGGHLRVKDLEERLPTYSDGTLRRHRERLVGFGVVERHERGDASREVRLSLTDCGHALADVMYCAGNWLQQADEPIALETRQASTALLAVADGWRMRIIPWIAWREFSLFDLERRINGFAAGEMKRRLDKLRGCGLIEPTNGSRGRRPYRPTEWGRRSAGPLFAAARWEYEHMPSISPLLGPNGTVAALRLAIELVELPADVDGVCQFTAVGHDKRAASIHFAVEGGRVVGCKYGAPEQATAWATGSPHDWLVAMLDRHLASLQLGGDSELAQGALDRLHCELLRY